MQHYTSLSRIVLASSLALSLALVSPASATPADSVIPPYENYTGWVYQEGSQYWFDSGIMARSKEIYDPRQATLGTGLTQTGRWLMIRTFTNLLTTENGCVTILPGI